MSKVQVPAKKLLEMEMEGVTFSVRRPTVKEQDDYSDAWESAVTSKERSAILKTHLINLGVPLEVINAADADQFFFILESISQKKS
jgi:hypothetical protein